MTVNKREKYQVELRMLLDRAAELGPLVDEPEYEPMRRRACELLSLCVAAPRGT